VEKVMEKYKGKPIGEKRCNAIATEITQAAGLENDEDVIISCYASKNSYDKFKTIEIRASSLQVNRSMNSMEWHIADDGKRAPYVLYEPTVFTSTPKKMRAMYDAIYKEGAKLFQMVQEYNEACGTLTKFRIKIEPFRENCINVNERF
jgi:hypothetical protein